MAMSEEEYMQDEPNDDDEQEGEFADSFLSAEEADGEINLILIPKFEYDLDGVLRSYLKALKKCGSTDEAMAILHDLAQQIKITHEIESQSEDIQDRVEELNYLMQQVRIV